MRVILYLVLIVVIAGMAYIRLAGSDVAVWHVAPVATEDKTMEGGALRVVQAGPDGLARLDKVARATARTRVLAGSVEEGMVTYITRSAVMGFPDYTTVRQEGDTLTLFARLRFGRSDFGVNAKRADAWLAAIQ